jgi:uncharacterized membrane protein HdeD (DUF308 family)
VKRDLWPYLTWWVRAFRGGELVILAPLLIPVGLAVLVASVVETDSELLGLGALFLLSGVFTMFFPLFSYRNKEKPWERPTDDGPTSRLPPWSPR